MNVDNGWKVVSGWEKATKSECLRMALTWQNMPFKLRVMCFMQAMGIL